MSYQIVFMLQRFSLIQKSRDNPNSKGTQLPSYRRVQVIAGSMLNSYLNDQIRCSFISVVNCETQVNDYIMSKNNRSGSSDLSYEQTELLLHCFQKTDQFGECSHVCLSRFH